MPLWGYTANTETLPTWLSDTEKRSCYATERGWVYNNPSTNTEEVLVCIGGLSGANSSLGLGAPNIMELLFTARDNAESDFTLTVIYNEKVSVDESNTPYIQLGGTYKGGDGQADYVSGTGTNQIVFTYTPVAGDNVATVTIPTTITLNDGYIVDAGDEETAAGVDFTKGGAKGQTDVRPDVSEETIVVEA